MVLWLAGVALQLGQASLWPMAWAQGACALAALALPVAWWLGRQSARGRTAAWAVLWAACALLAWGSTEWRAQAVLQEVLPPAWQDQDLVLEGRISGLPEPRGPSLSVEVLVQRLAFSRQDGGTDSATHRLPGRVILYWQPGALMSQVRAGQVWRWPVRLQAPVSLGNPGGFDSALWLFAQGVRASGSVRPKGGAPQLLQAPAHWWSPGMVDRARQGIREAIKREVSDARLAGVLAGLTVGDQAAIERDDWDVFRKTGVAHLVSISGLHIAMVGWMASGLLAWLWRRNAWLVHLWPAPQVQLISGVVFAALYSLLAGWGVPAQRTVCMMAVWALLKLSARRWPWPAVWLASAVAVTLMDPWALCQAGFWLSFVAVGVLMSSGTVVVTSTLDVTPWWLHAWRVVKGTVHTQWLTTLSLTPLSAVFFQQVSAVGFAANLFAIPVFTLLITPLALGGIVWAPLWSAAAWVLARAIEVLAWMAHWEWSAIQVAALPTWLSIASILAAAALVLPVPWRWRLIGLPPLLAVCWMPVAWRLLPVPQPGQFSLVAADVGQGTSVLIRTAHHALVFDAGPKVGERSDAGQRVVVPLLVAMGVTRLDELLISHSDTDHVGGAASIVQTLPVTLLHSSLDEAHPLRQAVVVGGHRLNHTRCQAGQQWQWDGVEFTVLHPSAQDYERRDELSPNALSCALRIQAKALPGREPVSALLAGDIETLQEAAVLQRAQAAQGGAGSLRSTVLVVPHHGSKTSSTLPFLQAVQPRQAVIQVARRNRYGHPSPEVIERYDALGIARVASPACGAFTWDSGEATPTDQDQALKLDPAQHLRLGQCWRQQARHYWD